MKKTYSVIFILISAIFFFTCFLFRGEINTNLTDAFVSNNSNENLILKNLTKKSSNKLNIIFSSTDKDELLDTVENFKNEINIESGKNYNDILDVYRKYPQNFLSDEYRTLIKNENLKMLSSKSLELLYAQAGFYVLPPDKDPFLSATNFLMSNLGFLDNEIKNKNGVYYSVLNITSNQSEMPRIYKLQKKYDNMNGARVYLTGTPIHTYLQSEKSKFEINIFCTISTIALLFLCLYIFRNLKIAIPVSLSILYGGLFGYSAAIILFKNIHVLTFVFATSLIGISLDYSLHYFFGGKSPAFKKSLTASMFTTVLAFIFLYFSNIEVLKEIAVFTSFGLFGTYLYVLFILPLFGELKYCRKINIPKIAPGLKNFILLLIFAVIISGGIKLHFNDSISNLYTPPKHLLSAEKIYREIFNTGTAEFITVKGNSVDNILEQEEKITSSLNKKHIKYIALSKFISSAKKQRENQKLIKNLYNKKLETYLPFLDLKTIERLKNQKSEIYDVSKFPLNSEFMLDNNTSFILLPNGDKRSGIKTLKLSEELSLALVSFRKTCLKLFPAIFLIISLFLICSYGFKKAAKTILPSLLGAGFSIGLISVFNIPVNLFHILGLFLITGFSLDYSIFRLNNGKNSETAVLISACSTFFSFVLLAFASFKLISSLGLILSIGILTSYILSLILIDNKAV